MKFLKYCDTLLFFGFLMAKSDCHTKNKWVYIIESMYMIIDPYNNTQALNDFNISIQHACTTS
ncbi:hypothetical protein AMTRI_Chr05g65670 [Amborella trichopoda]